MDNIQRVPATFFNAINEKEGSPYVFRGDENSKVEPQKSLEQSDPADDSEDEELDKFIAEIEDATDKEWTAEEAAEEEDISRLRYWNKEDYSGRFGRSERIGGSDFDNGMRGGVRIRKDVHGKKRTFDSDEEDDLSDGSEEWESDEESSGSGFGRHHRGVDSDRNMSRIQRGNKQQSRGSYRGDGLERWTGVESRGEMADSASEEPSSDLENAMFELELQRTGVESRGEMADSASEEPLSDLENAMFELESDEENHPRTPRSTGSAYRGNNDGEDYNQFERRENKRVGSKHGSRASEDASGEEYFKPSTYRDRSGKLTFGRGNNHDNATDSRLSSPRNLVMNKSESDPDMEVWDSDDMEDIDTSPLRAVEDDYKSSFREANYTRKMMTSYTRRRELRKKKDNVWDSD